MNWFAQIGQYEYLIMGIFCLLYLLFAVRTYLISRRLRSPVSLFWVKFLLRSGFLGLVIVSLLGPSFGGVKKEVKAVGKDIFIAMDLSRSITCRDIQPSRLEKMKFELKKVLEAFAADRIGLIVFSDEAFLYCPFTFDKGALQLFLETASPDVISSEGTDFGKALEMARLKFRESEGAGKKMSSRILILVSDGEDFGEETEDAAVALEKEGVKVFTLGIGTAAGGNIPLSDGGFLQDPEGNTVSVRLVSDDLRSLASRTGGKYFEVNDEKNEVPSLIEAIQNIEGEVWDVQVVDAGANKYFYFLFVALGLLLLDVLFTINILKV
jgi:Ca-activated chloride channel family protein